MNKTHLYGLIGFPLSHSFSKKYFTGKFAVHHLTGYSYENFPLEDISGLPGLLRQQPSLAGFNVTIPYKEKVLAYVDEQDDAVWQTGAANTVKVIRQNGNTYLKAYNTDIYGFMQSLKEWTETLGRPLPEKALVLGTGGASKAVAYVLKSLHIQIRFISRSTHKEVYKTYRQLDKKDMEEHLLIVNTTPLGMYPVIDGYPDIPYHYLTGKHLLYDLVYNPEETLFMTKGKENGAQVCNGKRMLVLQADKAWEIWQET